MAYGVPVVATRYSGNLDFMDDANSYLVDAREIEVQAAEGPYQRGSVWADPCVEHTAGLMRSIYDEPDDAVARAERGRLHVCEALSPASIAQQQLRALEGSGERSRPAAAQPS